MKENYEKYFLYGVLVLVIAVLIFSLFSFFGFSKTNLTNQEQNMRHTKMNKMPLTSFDSQLARQFMDKNNDGKCDACGMPVEMCMDSGQLQCNTDPESTIGVLGSQHIHADFKVYINGKPVNFADPSYYMKSSFIHVDDNQNKGDASGVLHMHATGVPLWIFFESIELKLQDGMKIYVNGKEVLDYENYVFNDLDKILITDSVENLEEQLNSITDYAKNH